MKNPKSLTDRQVLVMTSITNYVASHGYSPSVRDLCDSMGGISPSAVWEHLNKLEDKGFIKKTDGVARSVVVLK